jgi:hypothetical protein
MTIDIPRTLEVEAGSHYASRMGKGRMAGPGRLGFGGVLIVIAAFVVAQSVVHLVVVLLFHRMGTFVDLDRSNGLPDIVSTVALALAAVGTGAVAQHERGPRRLAATALAAVLAVLMLADLFHDGAHPSSATGPYVIALVVAATGLFGILALSSGLRVRVTLAVAVEGLELLGWSLVALAVWDEAIRRRRARGTVPTERASRAPVPSRRRAA